MTPILFCINEKPYAVWGFDPHGDNETFLKKIDADIYYRTAHIIIGRLDEHNSSDELDAKNSDDIKRDLSTLSRLLWHHGMETLVMMLGAYIQAPGAVHAYFLKSKTEDAIEIASALLSSKCPKYNRLEGAPFSLSAILHGIHSCAVWPEKSEIVERFSNALKDMIRDYLDEKQRWEYNSIKHGLRATHGQFGLAFGIERVPGVAAPPEAMRLLGQSPDASFFDIAKPLKNATKQQSKINFVTESVSLTWSFERVIMDLQLISIILHNATSALRQVNGAPVGSVTFTKIADDEKFWQTRAEFKGSRVPSATFAPLIDAKTTKLPSEKDVFDSYKRPRRKA